MSRRMPSGTTPVPDGASLPRMTRARAPASEAVAQRHQRGPAVAAVDELERDPGVGRDEAIDVAPPAATSCRR